MLSTKQHVIMHRESREDKLVFLWVMLQLSLYCDGPILGMLEPRDESGMIKSQTNSTKGIQG